MWLESMESSVVLLKDWVFCKHRKVLIFMLCMDSPAKLTCSQECCIAPNDSCCRNAYTNKALTVACWTRNGSKRPVCVFQCPDRYTLNVWYIGSQDLSLSAMWGNHFLQENDATADICKDRDQYVNRIDNHSWYGVLYGTSFLSSNDKYRVQRWFGKRMLLVAREQMVCLLVYLFPG